MGQNFGEIHEFGVIHGINSAKVLTHYGLGILSSTHSQNYFYKILKPSYSRNNRRAKYKCYTVCTCKYFSCWFFAYIWQCIQSVQIWKWAAKWLLLTTCTYTHFLSRPTATYDGGRKGYQVQSRSLFPVRLMTGYLVAKVFVHTVCRCDNMWSRAMPSQLYYADTPTQRACNTLCSGANTMSVPVLCLW